MVIKSISKKICNRCIELWQDVGGVSAVAFAIVLPLLIASGGMAVDLAQVYTAQNRLAAALDRAALAAAASTGDEQVLRDRAQAFFDANYPDDRIGTPSNIELFLEGNTIRVVASTRVDTRFMNVLGKAHIDIETETVVTRELAGIEVAMVLDVTGSMAGSNITALKTASTDFVNIMFDRITDAEYIKVGMVPYSTSVNVGPYGLGIDPGGEPYDLAFVDKPSTDPYFPDPNDVTYDVADPQQWHSCVIARDYPADVEDSPGNWDMYRVPPSSRNLVQAGQRLCVETERQCVRRRRNGSCRRWANVCTRWEETPDVYDANYICPEQHIIPLGNVRETLLTAIDRLQPAGWTLGNIGMGWGWRVLSPDAPFTEGEPYDNRSWRKAVLMMTDGRNEFSSSYYTAYEFNPNNLGNADLNNRFEEICNAMKQQGIVIYTVTFESNIDESTKDYYRRCATDPSLYHHAPGGADLIAIFQEIANQLSKLHISQ